jgi:hypothetical protein
LPIKKKNHPWQPYFCPIKMEWKPFLRGLHKLKSSKVWFQLAQKFQRNILFILANQKQKGQYLPCFLLNQIKMRVFWFVSICIFYKHVELRPLNYYSLLKPLETRFNKYRLIKMVKNDF